jgi:hypothetical protein
MPPPGIGSRGIVRAPSVEVASVISSDILGTKMRKGAEAGLGQGGEATRAAGVESTGKGERIGRRWAGRGPIRIRLGTD